MDNTLIKRAIQEYYTPNEWLLILLKNSWESEGNKRINYRDTLVLNEYVTIEINRYLMQPYIQVYIGVSEKHAKRPKWLSVEIDKEVEHNYTVIKTLVHNLLDKTNYEVQTIRNDYITVDAPDVSNQLQYGK